MVKNKAFIGLSCENGIIFNFCVHILYIGHYIYTVFAYMLLLLQCKNYG